MVFPFGTYIIKELLFRDNTLILQIIPSSFLKLAKMYEKDEEITQR